MVFIADYGAGNLRSVHKAFDYLGIEAVVSDKASEMSRYDKVLIPGVGAFGPAMEALNRQGFDEAIREHIDKGRSVLGICLGMQLFLSESEEMGAYKGLDIVPGKVLRFTSSTDKIPQIGWNSVDYCKDSVLFRNVPDQSYFYFVHSYYCAPDEPESVAATTFFAGKKFCSAIEKNGIFAVQFHPEKSSEAGLQVLKNFAEF
ncbi:MAG TPA: imidazole glycerol phosphate synthase subunit HisH [Chlorobaculum sp.]|uniref:Imidazole glycerol phosphate synthase subunit HisH n=1 Tax=Chlorobaculum tepidum (strain ATCC 49652 / DSM 12025 / NBRC 103806 / TLS) TaxID=194439 RepID=HIS5_CHLTE|nr:imidazole glycerol phosphate synthase subunit HisH [Chlorobaculum tepidum]Q8KF56.1 RecName: Full=Imidazole glycerol phosphate synthase subunit HisH; AltName: Full=IGP synthase glutaminase subunit; AltName: Full=IGP synthase subunit HisH; AltName: Full=ImGP synthase subunit HisH; Short=IGPS subunit HisH [Chlorobaculum tepidum TLS]AAM71718.1 amidotransferase HisH [Chlorobaculum tepidum TLS]HBU23519.1 imidazole glycerol phosphate synthase subunit HisH [Chlorobaculum sp.]